MRMKKAESMPDNILIPPMLNVGNDHMLNFFVLLNRTKYKNR